MSGMLFYGLLFPSLGTRLFPDQTNPGSSHPTLTRLPFGVCGYFYLHLTHPCSIFVTLCHPTHPYLLSPHFDFWFNPPILRDSESSYSSYFYLPPMSIIGYGPCARPALIMYVYKRLVSAVGIPQT